MKVLSVQFTLLITCLSLDGFAQPHLLTDFRTVVEERLQKVYRTELSTICPIDDDPVAEHVFWEYGAILVSNNGGFLPNTCMFEREAQLQEFQTAMKPF